MFSKLLNFPGGKQPDLNPSFANVVLGLHGDGTDGDTTIVDVLGRASPTSGRGTSAISTAVSKFGGSSIKFNGDGGLIYQTGSADTAFQFAGSFMIRCYVYVSGGAGTARVIYDSRRNGGSAEGMVLYLNPSNGLSLFTGSAFLVNTTTFPTNQLVHLAVTRDFGNPLTGLSVFQDGAVLTTGNNFLTNLTDGRCCVGEVNPEYQGTTSFVGYIDDFEIANGEPVYTTAFIPPTAPFPDS